MRSQRSLTQARKVCEKGEQKSAERIPLVIRADQVVSSVQNYAGRSAQKSKGCPKAILHSAVVALLALACGCGEPIASIVASA